MECLRKTISSDLLETLFDLPDILRGKMVEVIILPAGLTPKASKSLRSLNNNIKRRANPMLFEMEADVWRVAAEDNK